MDSTCNLFSKWHDILKTLEAEIAAIKTKTSRSSEFLSNWTPIGGSAPQVASTRRDIDRIMVLAKMNN